MRFDFVSALIGFAVGIALSAIVYRFRRQLVALRGQALSGAGNTRSFFASSAESRYTEEFSKVTNRAHLAGDHIELSEIYLEPRFIPAITPLDLEDTEKIGSVFHVVPMIHDFPAIYSSFNIPTMGIQDLQTGSRHLAVLGLPGIGKSTALAVMALYATGQIQFQSLDQLAEQVSVEEDKNLSESEREQRAKIRKEQQERALAQLRTTQQRDADKKEKTTRPAPFDLKKLLPVLVNVRDLDLSSATYNNKKSLDPAEPLVRAAMRSLGGLAAQAAPRAIYRRLAAGTCLVLIDGFDEVGGDARADRLVWLDRFKADYGANVILVAGGVEGFDPFVHSGFTPLYLCPIGDTEIEQLANRWAAVWGIIAGSRRKPAPAPEPKLVERVCAGNRGRTVLDITLKIWAAFANDEKDSGRRVGYDYFIRQHADDTLRAGLAAIADKLSDLNWGFIPKADLKIPAPGDGKTTLADLAEKALGKGLLVEAGTDSVTFRHPLLAACLAGESLKDAPRERLTVLATHPGWRDAIAFAAPLMSIEPMVLTRLSATPDLLNQSQLEIAYWLQDSPTDAGWRGELFRRFSLMLGGPSQYPLIRERAAAALVTSRDKNVSFVFRQALKSADANVRRLGCIGLGSLGDPEIIKDVSPLLADPDPDVQLAAGLGLGALRSDVALEKMMEGLYSGEESLRRAVAETFAAIPDATSILRETVNHEDVQVRRASVFGLARIKAPWALAILYRVLTDDPQWYVRSAAEEAFRKAETTEGDGPIAHPDAADLTWLIAWAAGRGEGVPAGAAARSILVRALQEGDPLHRAASAMTIAYLGYTPGLKPLYNALRDKDEAVRGTAYEALGILQMRLGKPLPAVLN